MLLALSKPIWVTLLSREGGKGTLLLGGIRVLCTEYGPYRGMRAPTIGKKWIELSQPLHVWCEKHHRHFLLVFLPLFQVRQLKDIATPVVLHLPRL